MKNNKAPKLSGDVIAALKNEARAGDVRAITLLRKAAVGDKRCRKFLQDLEGMKKTKKSSQPTSVNYSDLEGSWPIS